MPAPPPGRMASADRSRAAAAAIDRGLVTRVVLAAWLLPGGGHLLLGETRRGVILCGVLLLMAITGLASEGRLFPFVFTEPLVALAAAAQWALLGPRLIAALAGLGAGDVTAPTYEYGTTFLIVSGLLNTLVLLDASDRATRRRTR